MKKSEPTTRATVPNSVNDLRKRWEPLEDSFPESERFTGLCARMYRAFSWLERVEELAARDGDASADDQLIFCWTALNSLYGKWNFERNEPASDIQSLNQFTDRLFEIDEEQALVTRLREDREQILELLSNPFLSKQFWNDPTLLAADKRPSIGRKACTWYIEERYRLILEKLLLNVYYLRCQMIHGAAKRGSSLNRDSLLPCLRAIRLVLPTMLAVLIDHGAPEDWGPLCYPVIH